MELGCIGTGTMGNAMARCLIDGGHQLTVHDLRREATTVCSRAFASFAEASPQRAARVKSIQALTPA